MRIFTPEAAEQVIGLLCYVRTEDRYDCGCPGASSAGAFRLATTINSPSQLALSDDYDSLSCQTITIASALQKGLLEPSWEDLAVKLYLNDQDILYMCLMSHEEPVCLRLIEAHRMIAYRNHHIKKARAKKFTFWPGQRKKRLSSAGRDKFGAPFYTRTGLRNPRDHKNFTA